MNLMEVEVTAGRLLEEKKRLRAIESELSRVSRELKELPRRAEKDKKFYALIGLDWEEPKLKEREQQLKAEREAVMKSIEEAQSKILSGFSSGELVVPLEPNPVLDGGLYYFRFRSQASFPNTVEELSEILGIPVPLRVGEVTIWPDRIGVKEVDQYFAKLKVVEAFDNVRKTVSLKLSKESYRKHV
jgi:hypothetical protein